jgi:hypothetical protein
MKRTWVFFTVCVVYFTALFPLAIADVDSGIAAYRRGDYATAVKEWTPLAEKGDRDAQYNLGIAYIKGAGVPQNYLDAYKWMRKSADHGYVNAQYVLGQLYSEGKGVTQDPKEAERLYIMAAKQGYLDAQYNLAYMYLGHLGINKNLDQALHWFLISARRGYGPSQGIVASIYSHEEGFKHDPVWAYVWSSIALTSITDEGYRNHFAFMRAEAQKKLTKQQLKEVREVLLNCLTESDEICSSYYTSTSR